MSISILEILSLSPPLELSDVNSVQKFYVLIAEATASSKDTFTNAVEPLSETDDYLSTGLSGNIQTIIDIQVDTGFIEDSIDEILFVLTTLNPAINTYTIINDSANRDPQYNAVVVSLNNYIINNVLGVESVSGTDDGKYQPTLQLFIENDCVWTDPGGSPQSWLDLSTKYGFTVQ